MLGTSFRPRKRLKWPTAEGCELTGQGGWESPDYNVRGRNTGPVDIVY